MNSRENARQIAYLLEKRRWGGSASNKLLFGPGAVMVSPDPINVVGKQKIFPAAIITPTSHDTDPEGNGQDVNLVLWRFQIRLLAAAANDQLGISALIGGARGPDGLASSIGKGLEDILSEASLALTELWPSAGGITILGSPKDGSGVIGDADRVWAVYRDFNVEVWGTRDQFFHPPENLRAVVTTGGVALAWTKPPDRHDLWKMILCRVAGSTPTTNPATGVLTSWTIPYSGMASSYADTPSSGVQSYTLFAQYDDIRDTPASADVTVYATLTVTAL
jgi:hypothetical protein